MNLTKGCKIRFTESVYTPYDPNKESDFIGERTITGRIVDEGYAKGSGYHFFTIFVYQVEGKNADDVPPNTKITRRGVVVYPKCTIISTPTNYEELVKEKASKKVPIRMV